MNASNSSAGAADYVPSGAGLDELRRAAAGCQGCELYRDATQAVFGSGDAAARIVLVGEQPGDSEDREGAPFVGPAGRVLDRALDDAGIDRRTAYVTNAVKHFAFTRRGGRRIHQTPSQAHVAACRPWLNAELTVIDPEVTVCLGATAGRALLGPSFRVTRQRGLLLSRPPLASTLEDTDTTHQNAFLVATIHPSAVLRADDREAAYAGLVADLRVAAEALDA